MSLDEDERHIHGSGIRLSAVLKLVVADDRCRLEVLLGLEPQCGLEPQVLRILVRELMVTNPLEVANGAVDFGRVNRGRL